MTDWPDMRLLREYAEHGTEEAFTLLVGRHWAMVYHAAFRQTQNADAAEELVQTVFTLLCRKASRISTKVIYPAGYSIPVLPVHWVTGRSLGRIQGLLG